MSVHSILLCKPQGNAIVARSLNKRYFFGVIDPQSTTKAVTVKGYTSIFAESPRVSNFVPAEESNSVSSTEIYGGTLGSARTFPAGKHVQINCTISAEQPTTDFDG